MVDWDEQRLVWVPCPRLRDQDAPTVSLTKIITIDLLDNEPTPFPFRLLIFIPTIISLIVKSKVGFLIYH